MRVEIVGIRRGKTKTGKDSYNYFGLREFSDYDQENSECSGKQPVEAFSYRDYGVAVGDVVDFQYEPGYEGKAQLSNIVMMQPGGGNPFGSDTTKEAAKKDGK